MIAKVLYSAKKINVCVPWFSKNIYIFHYRSMTDELDGCETSLVGPEYGKTCFLLGKARSYYLYIPITLLMICNVLLYSSTVFILWAYSRTTRNVNANKGKAQKQS